MSSKPKRPDPVKKKRSPLPSAKLEQRLARLEKLLDLVLQASLRGRLLPSERRVLKRHLEQSKREQRVDRKAARKAEGPRCPACRLPIPDEKAERCPHCSVLLDVARKSRWDL